MAFVQRTIELAITLESGTFAGSAADTLTLKDLRMSTKVVKAGGATKGSLVASVYGMTLSQMNQLSTLGTKLQVVPKNTLVMTAGDAKGGMFTVFSGNITEAYSDMAEPPDNGFHMSGFIGAAEAVAPAKPTSFKGAADINTIMQALAKQMNLVFETNVPQGNVLSNQYLSGSGWNQMRKAAMAAGVSATIDDGVLAVWPKNGSRKTATPVDVSPTTGMIGYPAYTQEGIQVNSVYNPLVKKGGLVKVTSSLKPACGTWVVLTLDHTLECQLPQGKWMSTMRCYNPNQSVLPR